MADYDLAIIGGGLNGASIARDAAGRGLRVILLEQRDLASSASSISLGLVHGDLSALERRSFLRVRRALAERDVWLSIAPHLVRPRRFVVPAHARERPPWLLRGGLLVHDRLGGSALLPPSETVDVTHHPLGNPLQRPFGTAFAYSDCVADDARLTVVTARDAAAHGAEIRTGARCVRAERGAIWRLIVIDRGHRRVITSRALANAAGAWAGSVAETVLRMPPPDSHAVQITQIVVRRLYDTDAVYVFQHADGRLVFARPFAQDFTLVGSFEHAFRGDPAAVAADAVAVNYLCDAVNRYFRERIDASDVVTTLSGANLTSGPAGQLRFDHGRGRAPLITMIGGDVTTARRAAERAVMRLTPFYPMSRPWTARVPLPGGDFAWEGFDEQVDAVCDRWRFLDQRQAERLVGTYGTLVPEVLGKARQAADLGAAFGPDLTEAEVRYLMDSEWARFPDDIMWRRTRLGLTLTAAQRDALAAFMQSASSSGTQPVLDNERGIPRPGG